MPREVLARLRPASGTRLLDCTLGLGGHTELLLEAGAAVVAIDRDAQARAHAAARLGRFGGNLTILAGTFADVAERLAAEGERFDGLLADLGVSSMQLDDALRGFSIRADVRPDMRMGDGCGEDALGLIDRLSADALADILWTWGEERRSRRIASAIKRERAAGRCHTATELADVVRRAVPGHHPRHPALRTFQALRIAVNDEIGELERLLAALPGLLAPGGTAALISFHSLEDRAVKHALREHVAAGRLADCARKPEIPADDEQAENPRSTSAKLRWATAPIAAPRTQTTGTP